jgi:glycosyltransferase involved in cell wall biosynthesis
LFPSIYEKKRLAMIDCSDRVAVVSPPAARSIAKYACSLGYPQLASKILVVPHPVSQIMKPSKGLKPRKVLVVGRWHAEDKAQKDPELTMTVLGIFLKTHADWTAEVVGRGSTALQALAASWDADSRNRLTLTESVPRNELVERYQHSRILLCCSRFESFHISSAEAVCCGCSIIVADHPLLASTAWFTTRDSGTLSRKRQASHLASALGCEAAAWAHGQRQATGISANWTKTLHAADVAGALIEGACPESAQRDAPH